MTPKPIVLSWPEIELVRDFILVLVICKFEEDHINQRTSGPVNTHLIAGPGIYFNAFIHVYSPRAGADNPLVTNVDANRNPISLCPFVAGLKKNCFEV